MATLSQLRSDLVSQLGLLAIDEFIAPDELNRSINIGLQRFSRAAMWPHLMTYTTLAISKDDNEYALPADFDRLIEASIDQSPLQVTSLKELVRYKNITDFPSSISIQGSNFHIAPIPNANKTMDLVYLRTELNLNTDSDSPIAPTRYNDLIILFAALHQAARLKDTTLTGTLETQRAQYMKDAQMDLVRSTQTPRIAFRKDVAGWSW